MISYGVFLWSIPVIQVVEREWIPLQPAFRGRSAVVAAASFAVTVAIATASWWLVERPALRLKDWHRPHAPGRAPTARDGSAVG